MLTVSKTILAIIRDLPYALENVEGISTTVINTFVSINDYYDAVKAPSFTNQSIEALENIGKRFDFIK